MSIIMSHTRVNISSHMMMGIVLRHTRFAVQDVLLDELVMLDLLLIVAW